MLKKRLITILIISLFVISACTNDKIRNYCKTIISSSTNFSGIRIEYPQDSVIFPPEIAPPTFEWTDSMTFNRLWEVFLTDSTGDILLSRKLNESYWKPDSSKWEKIKKRYIGSYIYLIIINPNKTLSESNAYAKIRMFISNDSVGADIFFRAVTLPFSYAVKNVNTIEWYMGSVKGGSPRKMLDNMPVCANCHSFSKNNIKLAMDVDYGNDKGSYTIVDISDTTNITPNSIITWSDYKRDENEPTFGLLSQISPNGDYVLSTVKDLSVFVAVDKNLAYSQLFFPIKGIIGTYNIKTKTFGELQGANDRKYVQSNPSWSPDGKKVVFARTEMYINEKVRKSGRALLSIDDVKEFSSRKKEFKYDLYIVDFNDGKGGTATPIEGASNNGKSNYFPKFSPDGKWIVFCMADNFMLLQPDSRLYIMPANGGKPRYMKCNMEEMNSWHSWSPNSRWLVFSSKNKGLYTQLYLTHIDKNGNDSPPVLLENLRFSKRAANIPEFFLGDSKKFFKIKDSFSKTAPYYSATVIDNILNKYYVRAWNNLQKALEIDSLYDEAYFQRITLNALLQQVNSDFDKKDKEFLLKIINKQLAKNTNNENLLLIKATLLSSYGKTDEAIKLAEDIINKYPSSFKTYELICSIYRKTKQYQKAISLYDKMIKLFPINKEQLELLKASAYGELKRYNEALNIFNFYLNKYPTDIGLYSSKAVILMNQRRLNEAFECIKEIGKIDSTSSNYNMLITEYYKLTGNELLSSFYQKRTLKAYKKELEENPENIDIIFKLAESYQKMNNLKEAEYYYNLVLRYFPYNYKALSQKARIKLQLQQWDDAISVYDILIKHYEPNEELYNNQGLAYISIDNYEKALECINRAVEINPNNMEALFNRAKIKQILNDKMGALNDLNNIIKYYDNKMKTQKLEKSEIQLLEDSKSLIKKVNI